MKYKTIDCAYSKHVYGFDCTIIDAGENKLVVLIYHIGVK